MHGATLDASVALLPSTPATPTQLPTTPASLDAGAALRNDAASVSDLTTPRDAGVPIMDAAFASEAGQDASPADLGIQITFVDAGGALCPQGSYAADISSDSHAATITFSKAELQASLATALEGSCRLTFDLRVPAGFQFGQVALAPSGFAFVEQGAASLALTYSFPDAGLQQGFSHPIKMRDESFVFRDVADSVWSPTCAPSVLGKPLRWVVELQLSATIDAYINVTALDFELAQQAGGVVVRACPQP